MGDLITIWISRSGLNLTSVEHILPWVPEDFFFKVGENAQEFQIKGRGRKIIPLVARPQNLIFMRRDKSGFLAAKMRLLYWTQLSASLKIVITVMAIHFNSFNNFGEIVTMLYRFLARKID